MLTRFVTLEDSNFVILKFQFMDRRISILDIITQQWSVNLTIKSDPLSTGGVLTSRSDVYLF